MFEVVREVSPGDEVVAQLTPSPDMLLPAITLLRWTLTIMSWQTLNCAHAGRRC